MACSANSTIETRSVSEGVIGTVGTAAARQRTRAAQWGSSRAIMNSVDSSCVLSFCSFRGREWKAR
jgi:hypothetical protein